MLGDGMCSGLGVHRTAESFRRQSGPFDAAGRLFAVDDSIHQGAEHARNAQVGQKSVPGSREANENPSVRHLFVELHQAAEFGATHDNSVRVKVRG